MIPGGLKSVLAGSRSFFLLPVFFLFVATAAAQPEGEWTWLFNGSSLNAWRNYGKEQINPQWRNADGALMLSGSGGGDLITREEYENFELELEWKISEGGNSGVFFYVLERPDLAEPYASGPEVQIIDNERHRDAANHKHRAGDNYDLHACRVETARPAGEWNHLRLIVHHGKVQHWLNGTLVVEYRLWTPEWEKLVKASKFRTFPFYGMGYQGHIGLQDHGDPVWFRSIRIRRL